MSTTTEQILNRLNPHQRDAVVYDGGPLLVLAGPGSGKTRVITHRIAHLMGARGARPTSIMAVTFTNKAAREMVDRLKVLAPGEQELLTVGTFHAICARILRRDGAAIGLARSFNIADTDDQESIVKKVLRNLDLDEKRNPPRAFLHRISAAKSQLITPEAFSVSAENYGDEQAAVVYRQYQEALSAANLVDFDDLLVKAVDLFREHPPVLERYHDRYQHFLVDEFQDTNLVQYALVRQLGGRSRDVCVVGDEDQSVYSWRQADIRNILNFEADFPDARTIVLEQNYRSTRTILEAARAVIAANRQRKDKRLFTENDGGERIVVFEAYDENEEANYVATQVERLVASGASRLSDVAVMYRVNSQSRVAEKTFLRRRIPHKVVGMRFFERKEIRDLLGYVRLVHNQRDVASFDRIVNVPARQVGAKTLSELRLWASRLGVTPPEAAILLTQDLDPSIPCPLGPRPRTALAEFGRTILDLVTASNERTVDRLLEAILERTGYLDSLRDGTQEGDARQENVRELIQVAKEFSGAEPRASLEAFLEDAALAADADEYDASAEAVTLITLHAAKGLEFGTVFILGMEEGMCPHSRSVDDPAQLEEERRLLYVGVTRARRRLYLTYAARRSQFGESSARVPSRYFKDLPRELLQGTASAIQGKRREWSAPAGGNDRTFSPAARQNDRAEPRVPKAPVTEIGLGQRVAHATFGEGVVISVLARADDQEVTVAFPNMPPKKLLQSYAKLKVL